MSGTAATLQCNPVERWQSIGGSAPVHLERLGGGGVCDVYRLTGSGPDGRPVVAKRAGRSVLDREVVAYAELARAGIPAVQVLGQVDDPDPRFGWLFLAEAKGAPYRRLDPRHRLLVARWFAGLHASTGGGSPLPLPPMGPPQYEDQMAVTRPLLLASAAGRGPERAVCTDLLHAMDVVGGRWQQIADACGVIPDCMVHGDASPKNILVGDGPVLHVLDWETAGWGSPAPDLAELDLTYYLAAARRVWPGVAQADIARATLAGIVLRQIASVAWDAESLKAGPPDRVVSNLELYYAELVAAATAGGWWS